MAKNQETITISLPQVPPETLKKIREFIPTLPIDDSWRGMYPLCLFEDFWCFTYYMENILLAQEIFEAQPSDVFVCSQPKSGTTWLKALTFAIVTRFQYDFSSHPLLTTLPHKCMPNLNLCYTDNQDAREPGLPLIASHTPYTSLPKSVLGSDCKIVYICRNPKDAFVSMYHFVAKSRPKDKESISIEEAFALYCEGKSNYGPFWDHILGFWKASLEKPEKVLFLKYEEMREDPTFYVKKMADFMGFPFSIEEEEQGVVQKIVEMCSFEFLSNLEVNINGKLTRSQWSMSNSSFFRKGSVGDWKNHLTAEMAQRLDKIVEEKLSSYGLSFK